MAFVGNGGACGIKSRYSLHQPATGRGFSGLVPGDRSEIYDATLADSNLSVSTEDAYRLVKRAAREEGLLLSLMPPLLSRLLSLPHR